MHTSNIRKELIGLLKSVTDGMEKGNTNITDEQARFLLDAARAVVDDKMSKYQAAQYLGFNNTKQFDYLVSTGKIPKGRKQAGFKELFWYKKDLENLVEDK